MYSFSKFAVLSLPPKKIFVQKYQDGYKKTQKNVAWKLSKF